MFLICFSHLRWNFVYQRPQHLLSRVSHSFPVFYIEEPIFHDGEDRLDIRAVEEKIQVLTPYLAHNHPDPEAAIKTLLSEWNKANSSSFIAWFYTPMAIGLLNAFDTPALVVYDCMDELASFRFAPPTLRSNEQQLLEMADVVFTGGVTLYESKKHQHPNIHAFPSSIDKQHFGKAKQQSEDPQDQQGIPHPRIGFFGVLDERLDAELIGDLAAKRPDWQFVLIGPTVKIDPASLPRQSNIHYLGGKSYNELPSYLGGWDVALIPFAINEATRFISPTKTPEYLAGGIPVVSTPITDVVKPYGEQELVYIASDADGFADAIEKALPLKQDEQWKAQVDDFLSNLSWDKTWEDMLSLINKGLEDNANNSTTKKEGIHV